MFNYFSGLSFIKKVLFMIFALIGGLGLSWLFGSFIYRWWTGGNSLYNYFLGISNPTTPMATPTTNEPIILRETLIHTVREPSLFSRVFSREPVVTISEDTVERVYSDSNGEIIRILEPATPATIISAVTTPIESQLSQQSDMSSNSGVDVKDVIKKE